MTEAQKRTRERSRERRLKADRDRMQEIRAGRSWGTTDEGEKKEGNEVAGLLLLEKRVSAGLTRAHLARKIGVSYQAVSNYETGWRSPERKTAVLLEREVGMWVGLWDE